MYSTSNGYKQKIYSGDARHRLKLSFLPDTSTDFADLYCQKLTVKQRILPNGGQSFTLDNFMSAEAELILHHIDIANVPSEFNIELGTLVNNAYENIPIGHFVISDKPTTDKDKTTFKLYDNAIKFDFNYNGEPLINEKQQQGYQGATKLEVLQDICSQAGVQTDIESFLHSTDIVATYDNTITARAYISYLAEQSGAIAKIDRSGKLIFIYLNNLETVRIPLSIVEKYSIGKPYEIGRVVYEDGVRIFKEPLNEVANKDNLFINASNPYIVSQEQITSVYGLVNGFKIDSLNTGKIYGDPAIDPYDLIEIYDDKSIGQEVIAKTLATYTMTYNGKIINTYDTQIGEEARTENMSLKQAGEETLKRYVRSEIDEVNGTINLLAGEVHGEDGTGGLYGDTNQLKIDMYGTSGLVQSNIKDLENLTNEYRFSKEGFEMALKKSGNNLLTGTEFYDLSQWGWFDYNVLYEGSDMPSSKDYKYWYDTANNIVYQSDDWEDMTSYTPPAYNWTATNYTRKELLAIEKLEYNNLFANIIDSEETKSNFVSGRAVSMALMSTRPVDFDSTKGYLTLSLKYKKLVDNCKLKVNLREMNYSSPNYWESQTILYNYNKDIIPEDNNIHEVSIKMPIINNNVIEAITSETEPTGDYIYWLNSSTSWLKLYKKVNDEWVEDLEAKIVHTDLSSLEESSDAYLSASERENGLVYGLLQDIYPYQDYIARSLWLSFSGEDITTGLTVDDSIMIGDIKLEYGETSTVWVNNMNEVYGKNYKMDINGFEIDSNGYIMHIDEDEVTGSYNNEVQFQLNKDRTYSRKGQFVITDQNGLITQKLSNNIYVRYIE